MYFDHATLMESQGWKNAFFSMHHPKNFDSNWSKFFVNEIEFGHAYSTLDKIKMASKVIYSFEAQNKLRTLLNEYPASIAHLHCIYHHLSPAILPILKKASIPVVLTAHDLKLACPAYKMLNSHGICEKCKSGNYLDLIKYRCIKDSLLASTVVAMESSLHKLLGSYKNNVSRIVAPSQFFQNKLIEWGWPKEQITYIPNYVDITKFELSESVGKYFLYFGRLAPEKGVATLINAAIKAKVPLKIVGTGPLEAQLKSQAAENAQQIEFLGYKTGQDLIDLIQNSRCVVLPSEWYENAPMSVLESYAQGKTVIGAKIGGIPELINAGETGWMFESKNQEALADLLVKVNQLTDEKLMSMGHHCRTFVGETFNRQRYIDGTLRLYSELGVAA